MSTVVQKAHSPLGASSAERWMNCPGSNVLLNALDLPEGSDSSDFAIEGTNAHEAAAYCLRTDSDAWEIMGEFSGANGKFEVTVEMADGVQLYLDVVRSLVAEHGDPVHVNHVVEERISGDFHTQFYGTVDDAILGPEILDVTDFKYGAGIAVDAYDNPQLKYYAVGILNRYIGAKRVRLRIVQPRAFHEDGPVRVWETTAEELLNWKRDVLIPAMNRAEISHTLTPGDWCRFCPAKIACPLLVGLFGASVSADASALANYSNDGLARNYQLVAAVKHYIKALEGEVYARLNRGEEVSDGTKDGTFILTYKRANRVLSPDGVKVLELCAAPPPGYDPPFKPEEVYTKPEIKSPAQIDELGPRGKEFTKEYAYTPQTGLTVVPASSNKVAVKVKKVAEIFSDYAQKAEA